MRTPREVNPNFSTNTSSQQYNTDATRPPALQSVSHAKPDAFSRKLAGIANLDDLLWATAYQMAAMLHLRVVLLLPEDEQDEGVAVRAGYPPEDELGDADLAAAKWCWQHKRPAGRGACCRCWAWDCAASA